MRLESTGATFCLHRLHPRHPRLFVLAGRGWAVLLWLLLCSLFRRPFRPAIQCDLHGDLHLRPAMPDARSTCSGDAHRD